MYLTEVEEARPVPAGWFGLVGWLMAILPTGSIWVAGILPPRDQTEAREGSPFASFHWNLQLAVVDSFVLPTRR